MHAGLVRGVRNHRGIHVDEVPVRMAGEKMPAALLAPLALAFRCLGEDTNLFGTLRHLDGLRLPERKRVDRPCRPRAAGLAVAVAHRRRLARHPELHPTTETSTFVRLFVGHGSFLLVSADSILPRLHPPWPKRRAF